MTRLSDRYKHKYVNNRKKQNTGEMVLDIVNEYYKIERDHMLTESNVLMEFIKYLKDDPRNFNRMKDITLNIRTAKNLLSFNKN